MTSGFNCLILSRAINGSIGDAIKAGKYDEATLSIEGRINEGVEMGILTADEGEFMIAFEKDVLEMVHVDHFPLEHFGTVAENHDKAKKTSKKKSDEATA